MKDVFNEKSLTSEYSKYLKSTQPYLEKVISNKYSKKETESTTV